MSMKIIGPSGVPEQINAGYTTVLKPDNQNKSYFINACINFQLLVNYLEIWGGMQYGQSDNLRKLFYLHCFAQEN